MTPETAALLSEEDALLKRQQLLEEGFGVVPGVLPREFVEELRTWLGDLLARTPVLSKVRYQGSEIQVAT
jgi:hypothetical protein